MDNLFLLKGSGTLLMSKLLLMCELLILWQKSHQPILIKYNKNGRKKNPGKQRIIATYLRNNNNSSAVKKHVYREDKLRITLA